MQLLRLVACYVEPPPDGLAAAFPMVQTETITLDVLRADLVPGRHLRLLIGARACDAPVRIEDHELLVPDELRIEMERLVEHAVNVFCIRKGRGRRLRSPSPCVGFIAETQEDEAVLVQAQGVRGQSIGFVAASPANPITDEEAGDFALEERSDGVALLAEALSARTGLGEFHELIRVFERGFKLAGGPLVQPLADFLGDAPGLGYDREEVEFFLKQIRDPATHADRRATYILEGGVRPVLARVRQAAYDTLLNKANWRSPDSERRNLWSPAVGLASPAVPFIVRGAAARLVYEPLDQFGIYPYDMSVAANEMPAGTSSWAVDGTLMTGEVEIR